MRIGIQFLAAMLALGSAAAQTREIPLKVLRDKIAGGWAGQMIGVSFGAPTEFRSRGKIIEGDLPKWTPERIKNALGQDDLYVDMTFAKVLDDKGLDATADDFGAMFRDAQYALWHANLSGRRNLKRGVPATLSGTPRYNAHADDIDFQIEADFIGLMAPGLYRAANDIALRAGRVMNYGDGIYGGMFVSAMYAAAFFESDPRRIVETGLAAIPRQSPYGRLVADLLAWHKQYPDDWKKVWQLIEDKWNKNDPCPAGALQPYNIDAKLNGAYIALGLLYGKGDFGKTIEISTRAGQDSDCNPASSGGILGVVLGYERIPEEWKGGIPAIANEKFRYTDFSFNTIVESTEKRAIGLVKRNGGRVEGDKLLVRLQTPKPPKLQTWKFGTVAELIGADDARWTFSGPWRTEKTQRIASAKGAELTVTFEGTGAIVVGPYLAEGGKADVYLDGKLDRTVDVCSDEKGDKRGDSVWHAFGLKPGKHTVRLAVRGEPYGDRKGTGVAIESLVVFR
ncbi:MAG: ADP-ribosylglycohydrolase family protein [Acidobacteriota bacterium]